MKKYYFVIFTPFILIAGCSSGENETTIEQSSKEPIINDQMLALEKAKEVEQIIQRGMEKRVQDLEEESE
jgi:uncharacterized protein YcfL